MQWLNVLLVCSADFVSMSKINSLKTQASLKKMCVVKKDTASVLFKHPLAYPPAPTKSFAQRHHLRSIQIPSSVQEIGDYALHDCKNLCDVELPSVSLPELKVLCFQMMHFAK